MYRPAHPDTVPTEIGTVYVLHFSAPVGTEKQQARHYIGWAADPDARIRAHREGRAGKLTKYAVRAGITLEVAALYPGVTRDFERRLKNRGGAARHCPTCIAELKARQERFLAAETARRERRAGRKVAA